MKNYVIIGASRGIGKALTRKLAQSSRVYATYHSHEPDTSMANVQWQQFDVMSDDFDSLNLPEAIDGLVYCPGSINLKPFRRFSDDEIQDDLKLQVLGALNATKAGHKALKKDGGASVVFISTVAVQKGFAYHTQVAISKGALEGMTRTLAAELAPEIRVNCVAPSLTDTQLAGTLINTEEKKEAHGKAHPLGRVGEPEDIAETIAFLLSDASAWMTGQVLHIDGGRSTLNK